MRNFHTVHPEDSEAIIYLLSGNNDPFGQVISENYAFIVNRFKNRAGITFIYPAQAVPGWEFS